MHALEVETGFFCLIYQFVPDQSLLVRHRPELVAGGLVWVKSKLTGFHVGPLGICFIYLCDAQRKGN